MTEWLVNPLFAMALAFAALSLAFFARGGAALRRGRPFRFGSHPPSRTAARSGSPSAPARP